MKSKEELFPSQSGQSRGKATEKEEEEDLKEQGGRTSSLCKQLMEKLKMKTRLKRTMNNVQSGGGEEPALKRKEVVKVVKRHRVGNTQTAGKL